MNVGVGGFLGLNRNQNRIYVFQKTAYGTAQRNITARTSTKGLLKNHAGICNGENNVFGVMPSSENAADIILGNQDGLVKFETILAMLNA